MSAFTMMEAALPPAVFAAMSPPASDLSATLTPADPWQSFLYQTSDEPAH